MPVRPTFSRFGYDAGTNTAVATLPDGTTEITLGGAPGGSTTQGQFNISGAFAGFSSWFWDSVNSCASVLTRIGFKNGSSIGALVWNPSTGRTLTLPDATDTIVGRATTDTLTGKTQLLANNTLTDTGAAVGGVIVHDGTRFIYLAAGANGTFLGRSAGVTGFFTPSGGGGSPGGSSGELQWNSAGSFAGTTHWTTDGSGMIADSSGYIEMGSTSPATSGWIRIQAAAADVMVLSLSGVNTPIISHDGSGFVYVGANVAGTHACNNLQLEAVTDVRIGTLTALGMKVTTTDVQHSLPVAGASALPMRFEQTSIALSGTTHTISSAEMAFPSHIFTGSLSADCALTYPASAGSTYWIYNGTTGGHNLTLGEESSLGPGAAWLIHYIPAASGWAVWVADVV